MTDLRTIETKHKAQDADILRRAVAELDKQPRSPDVLQLLLYAINQADRIDHAFRRPKVVALRPEPPKPAA